MLKVIMIMIVSRIDATQIFFRTGQLSLFEKKTKYFPIFTPPPLSFGHPRSTSTSFCIKWIVGQACQRKRPAMFLASGGTDVFVLICQSSITSSPGVVNS